MLECKKEKFFSCVKGKDVYIWGIGTVLEKSVSLLQQWCNIEGGFDRNVLVYMESKYGFPLYPMSDVERLDKNNTVFLITCIYVTEIQDFLRQNGFKYIFNIFTLLDEPTFRFHPPINQEYHNNIEKLNGLLADDKSRGILDRIVNKRKAQCCDYGDICEQNQYFPTGVWKAFNDEEVFVDAGAFTGDTIYHIKEVTNNKFKRIYAFEPDKANFEKLVLSIGGDRRIKCYSYATWDKVEKLCFSLSENASSLANADGDFWVEGRDLDQAITEKITFLKMDVEGAELKSLQGAKKLIQTYKPKLAICVYHEPKDIWEIPFYIHELVPEYKLYLRHHHKAWFETVLYATV